MFQSARPHGARHESSSFGNGSDVFQSARPHGARPSVISGCLALSPFQSARPHGARPRPQKGRCRRNRFNPHARTGRDHDLKKDAVVEIVSIRAPARGATRSFRKRSPCTKGFNPRARTGRDISMPHFTVTGSMFQSARPHGARRPRRRMTSARHQSFNPRARTGRDSTLVKMVCQASFRGTFREPLLSAAGEDGKSAERMRKPSIAAIANPPGNP